jgi:hypothetical protein
MSQEERIEGLGELKNGLEALVNLVYLIKEDRAYSDRVLRWVEMADIETGRMAQVLRERPPQELEPSKRVSADDFDGLTPRCSPCKKRDAGISPLRDRR